MNRLANSLAELSVVVTNHVKFFLFKEPPFPSLQLLPIGAMNAAPRTERSVKDILNEIFDGFLWDTPKHRRPVESRLKRKFGAENWKPHGYKMIDRKFNIVTCTVCGNFHERQYLCETCYEKVKVETDEICEAMLKAQGFEPIERDVAVRYKDESRDGVQNAQIVEIDKERPSWFSKNLLSRVVRKPTTVSLTETEPSHDKN